MKRVTIEIPDYLYNFYEKIGRHAGISTERVIADTLFKLAGKLSAQILSSENMSDS